MFNYIQVYDNVWRDNCNANVGRDCQHSKSMRQDNCNATPWGETANAANP